MELDYELPQMKYPEQKGLVSIIVPIYNTKETYLKECLDSIFVQTFANWEAILVNDGSTDNTKEIIDEYAKKDSRFVAIHKQNEGTLLARKTGLENSRGEFIANLDHDDTYDSQFLKKMHAKITEVNADFVYCKRSGFYTSQATDCKWNAEAYKNLTLVLPWQKVSLLTWDKLIKREIYAKVRFPNMHLTAGEDPVQIIQVAYYSKSVAFIPEYLYFHRPEGISSVFNPASTIKSVIAMDKLLKDFFNDRLPKEVENVFFRVYKQNVLYCYYMLDKKTRTEFKNELEPHLPDCIKLAKLDMKIPLFLASKGIIFPLKLRNFIRLKIYLPIKKQVNRIFFS
ncbi:MAG: glycosyltransferase [Fibromonadaceae bacterium]|jgi:glycosyltransferase involved in cell wall biosynthesis|nr:glycosyltransferase [Fibromonadaceae bacterium]